MSEEPPSVGRELFWFAVWIIFITALWFFLHLAHAEARDLDGRYANSELHEWFNHLASGKGLCCSFADGYAIEDADWEVKAGHYRVRVPNKAVPGDPMTWVDVPDDAVITEPNRAGKTMVWPIYGYMGTTIRCFMPGTMG